MANRFVQSNRLMSARNRAYVAFKIAYMGKINECVYASIEEADKAYVAFFCDNMGLNATQADHNAYWAAADNYFAERKGVALCSNHSKTVSSVNPDEVIYPSRALAKSRSDLNRHHRRQLTSVRFQREQRRRMALLAAGIAA